MTRTRIITAILMLAVVGCATETVPDKCLRYGFVPHTDGFSNCMLQLDNQ